jgi:hypothetical protein
MYIQEKGWKGVDWIHLEESGAVLWTQSWTSGFHNIFGNFWRAEALLASLGLYFMEFSSRTFSSPLLCKVRHHVSYQCKTKDTRLILKWITSSVFCKDLERAQPDLWIHFDSNSSHCDGTTNVAVGCSTHRFAFMSVNFKSRPADPLY